MNRAAAVLVALATLLVATVSCNQIIEDNGVHLGMAILAGAEQLRASTDLERTVVAPKQLSVDKQGGTTEVVLRKNGQAIEVVAVR